MRKSLNPAELGFGASDRRRLAEALGEAAEARLVRRIQAVLLVAQGPSMRQEYFQEFLRLLCQSHPGRQIRLVLDKASCHTAPQSQALARSLDIVLIWLPKQWPELNGMDQLWRGLKTEISANVQFKNIEEEADAAQQWIASLSKTEALRKAGIFAEGFWLRSFLPIFS